MHSPVVEHVEHSPDEGTLSKSVCERLNEIPSKPFHILNAVVTETQLDSAETSDAVVELVRLPLLGAAD
mgnify:FL=1